MPVEIRVPQMGESVTEATILRWLKKEGETVAAGEAVAELETDKVNVEVPADTAGVIQSFAHAEGDTVAVGDVLAVVGDAAPPRPPLFLSGSRIAPPPRSQRRRIASRAQRRRSRPSPPPLRWPGRWRRTTKLTSAWSKAPDRVGRITKDDVANYLERSSDAPADRQRLAARRWSRRRSNEPPPNMSPLATAPPASTGKACPCPRAVGRSVPKSVSA